MKDKKIFVVLIVLVVLNLFMLYLYNVKMPELEKKKATSDFNHLNFLYFTALEEKDVSYCHNVSLKEFKDFCYLEVATLNKDPQQCYFIKGDMFSQCIISVAVADLNLDVCEILDEKYDECYFSTINAIAVDKKDADECERQKTDEERNRCIQNLAETLEDESFCLVIDDSFIRDTCLFNTAMKTYKQSACEQISDEKMRQGCANLVRFYGPKP